MGSLRPDGTQVAFSLFNSETDNQICAITTEGKNLRVYGKGYDSKWSPDGKQILFTRKVGDYSKIYKMDSESGGNLVELSSSGESNDHRATWSPDGSQIVFISDRSKHKNNLFLMDSDGQSVVQLTDDSNVHSVDWGKDNYIYFSAQAGDNWDIWRLKINFD